MKNKQNGFTIIELAVVIVILFLLTAIFLPMFSQVSEKSRSGRCNRTLSQFGKVFNLYLLDFGKQTLYPEKNGQGFITALYKNRLLIETAVYLCPSTADTNDGFELLNAPDNGDANGPVSYAGRKNKDQSVYPGLFELTKETPTTPIMSDDMGEPYNHENGTVMFFLFLDGHVDHIRQNDRDFGDILDVLGN